MSLVLRTIFITSLPCYEVVTKARYLCQVANLELITKLVLFFCCCDEEKKEEKKGKKSLFQGAPIQCEDLSGIDRKKSEGYLERERKREGMKLRKNKTEERYVKDR